MSFQLRGIGVPAVQPPPFIVVWGPEGSGKTSFCAGASRPLFVCAEQGARALGMPCYPYDANDATLTLDSFEELRQLLWSIAQHGQAHYPYDFVIVDSASSLEPLIHAEVCAQACVASIADVGGGFGKGHMQAANRWLEVCVTIQQALARAGIGLILIAHQAQGKNERAEGSSYDEYKPDLNKRASAVVLRNAEHVIYLGWETRVAQENLGFEKTHSYGTGHERKMYLQKTPFASAKNRWGLPATIDIPESIEHPTVGWDLFKNAAAEALARRGQQAPVL
ncbi:MAG: AAA family ATPase [bacterium]|nr:AAA family ATPase [bacterium]